ncbi:upstream activation factor subunit spp27 [Rhododendron vialii]|uniref:upstream activation factor subunit spp27 n=1 Tax=Rhododendron vialii TaxID=182163 RepID=UPI00265F17D0|nr:upstream activation factor subunit spp27 [Rhododendron vialii]
MSSIRGFAKDCRALMAASSKAAVAPKPSSAAKPKRPKSPTKKKAPPSSSELRKPPRATGILKVSPVSPALRQFLGAPEASRTDAVKKIWEYIKLRNLQNPADKREIYCDDKLKTIFEGKDKVGFLEIGKLLSGHFVKAN